MRATAVRRTATAAAVASLALLATACGGSESGDGDTNKDKATAESSATTQAAKALTAAELEKVVLAQGDLEKHTVVEPGAGDVLDAKDVKVENAACEPIAYAMSNAPIGEPGAEVHRMVSSDPEEPSAEELAEMSSEEQLAASMNLTITALSLYAYEDKGAEEALADVRTAAEKCADGFTSTAVDQDVKVTKITEETTSGGDEAAAWTVTTKQDGETLAYKVVVVRQSSTLASFASVDFSASMTGEESGLPTALVDAQLAKLG